MKKLDHKIILGGAALTAVAANAYFLLASQLGQNATPEVASPVSSSSTSPAVSSTSSVETASSTQSETTEAAEQTGATEEQGLKDGTYTGEVTHTARGDYQVQITVSQGEISDIQVLLYPTDNPNSERINQGALPTYIEDALAAQSSDIQLISGASEAFKGFTGSLQDAINQAS